MAQHGKNEAVEFEVEFRTVWQQLDITKIYYKLSHLMMGWPSKLVSLTPLIYLTHLVTGKLSVKPSLLYSATSLRDRYLCIHDPTLF